MEIVRYELSSDGTIVAVGGEWDAVARNNAAEELLGDAVVGTPVWRWIRGTETRHLLRKLFEGVTASGRVAAVPYRCDGPVVRRYMWFEVHPLCGGGVEVVHRTLREELRARGAPRFDHLVPHGGEPVRMCSWCNALDVAGEWLELEDAMKVMPLLVMDRQPPVTHGICPGCEAGMVRDLGGTR